MKQDFIKGMRHGFPIFLGYFFVSFAIGIMASRGGLPTQAAMLISLTNLTSAGEAAGIGVMTGGGTLIEMALTQLLINCRYSLMGLSLSQKLSNRFTTPHRMAASFGITDEIFGVAAAQKEPLTPAYMYGMISIATVGWTTGTYIGAVCGNVFPTVLVNSLGILLYGMFMAIIIPPIRESRSNLAVVLLAAGFSCVIYYCLPMITSGFSIIISAVAAAAILALVRPVEDEEEEAAAASETDAERASKTAAAPAAAPANETAAKTPGEEVDT